MPAKTNFLHNFFCLLLFEGTFRSFFKDKKLKDSLTVKRFPYFAFPKLWNDEPPSKLNPKKKLFCSAIKSALLSTIIV
jgi:hypothetical protein